MWVKANLKALIGVAPFAGAWIEIRLLYLVVAPSLVAPFAGAWIEIHREVSANISDLVAPFAGAWIEMTESHSMKKISSRRSLRGSVD